METLHVTGAYMLILRVQEFAFANSMMFIETSAKTRPEQIHVQLQIFELVLRVDFESFFGWSRAEAKGGSIGAHAIACCYASSLFGLQTKAKHSFHAGSTDTGECNGHSLLAEDIDLHGRVDRCLGTEAVHVRASSFYHALLGT